MKIPVSQQILDAYSSFGKNPNYALTFLLDSLDIDTATKFMSLSRGFQFDGTKSEFDLDTKNATAVAQIFGVTDATVVEKLLWVAALFPEI